MKPKGESAAICWRVWSTPSSLSCSPVISRCPWRRWGRTSTLRCSSQTECTASASAGSPPWMNLWSTTRKPPSSPAITERSCIWSKRCCDSQHSHCPAPFPSPVLLGIKPRWPRQTCRRLKRASRPWMCFQWAYLLLTERVRPCWGGGASSDVILHVYLQAGTLSVAPSLLKHAGDLYGSEGNSAGPDSGVDPPPLLAGFLLYFKTAFVLFYIYFLSSGFSQSDQNHSFAFLILFFSLTIPLIFAIPLFLSASAGRNTFLI